MNIIIDNREKRLIKLVNALRDEYGLKNLSIKVEKLDLGDVIIKKDKEELLVLERKSLNDLASSIKDGRYDEQSFRLANYSIHNHNIIYLIEGDLSTWEDKRRKMHSKTLYAALFSLNYYKGFSTIRTTGILDTAEYILRVADKLNREKNKKAYYSFNKKENINPQKYCEVVSKVKKENLTPENIGEIILSQIPSVNSTTSMAILKQHGSLFNLLNNLKKDQNCLDKLRYETKSGEMRRISKTSIRNIVKYLLYQKNNVIKIDT
jgi:ERCC4-type nuclease